MKVIKLMCTKDASFLLNVLGSPKGVAMIIVPLYFRFLHLAKQLFKLPKEMFYLILYLAS